MSNVVYPVLPGLRWPIGKIPRFSTVIKKSVSGREVRAGLMSYPVWEFSLGYEVLRAESSVAEMQIILNHFLAHHGDFDSFLFTDDSDCAVVAQPFGIGDGTTASFQLVRSLVSGGFLEPVMNLNGTPDIFVDAVEQTTGFSISASGLVTFVAPPADGDVLTWSGNYYFRCRYRDGLMQLDQFMKDLWENRKVALVGCLGDKI